MLIRFNFYEFCFGIIINSGKVCFCYISCFKYFRVNVLRIICFIILLTSKSGFAFYRLGF